MPLPTKTASNPATRRLYSLDMSRRNRCDPLVLLREVEYARPSSVEEAIQLLGAHEGARALAGGQTLVNVMKARAASPDVLVDLNRLEELRAITVSGDTLQLGAMATYTQMMASSEVDVSRPILAEVAAQIADVQVRNRGTIGGNICSNDPTNHLPPLLVALGASMTIRGAAGERTVPADEFFLGVYMTVVGEGELLLSVSVPAAANAADGFSSITIGRDGTCLANAAASLAGDYGADRARLCRRCSRPADPHEQRREQRPPGGSRTRTSILRPTCTPPRTIGATWPASARCAPSSLRGSGASERGADDEPDDLRRRQRRRLRARRRRAAAARPLHPRRARADRNAHRLRHRQLRRLHRPPRRSGGQELHAARRAGRRRQGADGRGARAGRRRAEPAAAVLLLPPRPPVRLLHARDADERLGAARAEPAADGGRGTDGDPGQHLPLHRLRQHRRGDRERETA